jgi:c-di-GMP-binding flagellar brake protein YcgR
MFGVGALALQADRLGAGGRQLRLGTRQVTHFELPLYDFSCGGVGLRATPAEAYELHVGKKLEGVQLDLGPSLTIQADLEVRLLRPFRTFLLGEQVQIGCRISNIDMVMRQKLERAVSKQMKR